MPVAFSDAALGTSVEVPSIDGGKSKIKIPAGTQHGKQFRLKGKGMPVLRRNIYGDLYIRIVTQVPTSLSKRQKEILEEFNDIEVNKPDPVIKSFFEKSQKILEENINIMDTDQIMHAIFLIAVLSFNFTQFSFYKL